MSAKFIYQTISGQWDKAIKDKNEPISRAATIAVRDVSDDVKTRGRADIAGAGFSKKWQNALRVDSYPRKGENSVNAAAFIYHKIPYAGVFEDGATIRGKPYLWLTVSNAPKKIGKNRMTPKLYTQKVGELNYAKVAGKAPMLTAQLRMSRAKARRKDYPKLSLAALRKGRSGGGATGVIKSVPVFVGVPQVRIPKRFNIYKIISDGANRLASAYVAAINRSEDVR